MVYKLWLIQIIWTLQIWDSWLWGTDDGAVWPNGTSVQGAPCIYQVFFINIFTIDHSLKGSLADVHTNYSSCTISSLCHYHLKFTWSHYPDEYYWKGESCMKSMEAMWLTSEVQCLLIFSVICGAGEHFSFALFDCLPYLVFCLHMC